ncbi:hypothetical protein [Bacillus mycoides]|uniref:hypothetical protein n=1 Tax=Bacillus mycoides TaxID=1405 RepID=UPI003D001EDF
MLDILAIIFFLVTLVLFILLILGLFKPEKVPLWGQSKTRLRVFSTYPFAIMLSFVLGFTCAINSVSMKEQEEKSNHTAVVQENLNAEKETIAKPEQSAEYERIQKEIQKDNFKDNIKKVVSDTVDKKNMESVEINDNLGTDKPHDKIVLINIKARDSLTNNMIKKGMWMDTSSMLEKLAQEKNISEITFFWKSSLVDQYGNDKNETIMKINIDRTALDKINFKNFTYDNIPNVATQYWQHPAVDKK